MSRSAFWRVSFLLAVAYCNVEVSNIQIDSDDTITYTVKVADTGHSSDVTIKKGDYVEIPTEYKKLIPIAFPERIGKRYRQRGYTQVHSVLQWSLFQYAGKPSSTISYTFKSLTKEVEDQAGDKTAVSKAISNLKVFPLTKDQVHATADFRQTRFDKGSTDLLIADALDRLKENSIVYMRASTGDKWKEYKYIGAKSDRYEFVDDNGKKKGFSSQKLLEKTYSQEYATNIVHWGDKVEFRFAGNLGKPGRIMKYKGAVEDSGKVLGEGDAKEYVYYFKGTAGGTTADFRQTRFELSQRIKSGDFKVMPQSWFATKNGKKLGWKPEVEFNDNPKGSAYPRPVPDMDAQKKKEYNRLNQIPLAERIAAARSAYDDELEEEEDELEEYLKYLRGYIQGFKDVKKAHRY